MIDVQRMRQIVDDVEQGVAPGVAQAAVRGWSAPGAEEAAIGSLHYVRSSANHIFRFRHEGRLCYLRLAHAAEREPSALAAELDFVRHVAQAGVAVALPIASTKGRLIEEVVSQGQRYWAVVFEGLQGQQFECEELDEAGYRL